MKNAAIATVIALAFILSAVKVRNELKMTQAYDRQAVALERIANGLRDGLYLTDDSLDFLKRWDKENKGATILVKKNTLKVVNDTDTAISVGERVIVCPPGWQISITHGTCQFCSKDGITKVPCNPDNPKEVYFICDNELGKPRRDFIDDKCVERKTK